MQQRNILFFSCEPGGAEVLIPLTQLLSAKKEYRVIVLSYGLGAERFSRKGIAHCEINRVIQNDRSLFESHQPDILITSATSHPEHDMSEKYLWQTAKELAIPSLAILDQWQNYAIRFSGPTSNENLTYLPDYINSIDEIGKQEMIALGFASEKLLTFGHPYLSTIRDTFDKINVGDVINRLGLPANPKVALFVSEPILEYYGRTRGYDQYQALSIFLEAIKDNPDSYLPLIKLHPKDQPGRFKDIIQSYPQLTPLIVNTQLNSLECLAIADLIVGMTSIMLIEAFALGKIVISLQPGLKTQDPLILSRYGIIPIAQSPADINRPALTSHTSTPGFNYKFDQEAFQLFLQATLH